MQIMGKKFERRGVNTTEPALDKQNTNDHSRFDRRLDYYDGGSLYPGRPPTTKYSKLNPDGLEGYYRWLYANRHRSKDHMTFEEWMGNDICWIR